MIVDLAHVQRRADAPLIPLSESPLTDDVFRLHMPETATPEASATDDAASATQLPNHEPSEQPVQQDGASEDVEEEPAQWNITSTEWEPDNTAAAAAEVEAEETDDKADSSRPKASAAHNLPKLIMPEPADSSARKRRLVS